MKNFKRISLLTLFFCTLTACNDQVLTTPDSPDLMPLTNTVEIPPTSIPTPKTEPPSVLTICSREPESLFIYGDTTAAARHIRQAIYDGPLDTLNYQGEPVILERMPSFESGDAWLQPVEVAPGDLVIDAKGAWVTFEEGVLYRPSGCTDASCALTYESQEPVQMDAMVLHFQLIPTIHWSDGEALSAADSVFSFEVYKSLFQRFSPETLRVTRSYRQVDDQTVEWMGIPGYVGTIASKFFTPLPAHQLSGLDGEAWLNSPLTNRKPLGWGPYIIVDWVDGDHLTLDRNTRYFRAEEGYPPYDHLVYRFFGDGETAIDALLIGECDLVDQDLLFEKHVPRLQNEQGAGNLKYFDYPGDAWELLALNLDSLDTRRLNLFELKLVRQAIAMCIDRQKLSNELMYGYAPTLSSYMPVNHPLNQGRVPYPYDPDQAVERLEAVGWVDHDLDPNTPLVSYGVEGIPDGTYFEFTYQIPSDGIQVLAAQRITENLENCGFGVELMIEDWDTLMAPGPEGSLFGRLFEVTQFAWSFPKENHCSLFTSAEIPGPYPEYPKGWGGANLSGYRNPSYDDACLRAAMALPGSEADLHAQGEAQEIFGEDQPVIPLYQHFNLVAMRADMCVDAFIDFSQIETLAYGEYCD